MGSIRLTKTEQRVIDWMRDGDRALHKHPHDETSYGHGSYGSDKWTKICSRKVVESLIAKGLIEWFSCYPPDLRAMLVENRHLGPPNSLSPSESEAADADR